MPVPNCSLLTALGLDPDDHGGGLHARGCAGRGRRDAAAAPPLGPGCALGVERWRMRPPGCCEEIRRAQDFAARDGLRQRTSPHSASCRPEPHKHQRPRRPHIDPYAGSDTCRACHVARARTVAGHRHVQDVRAYKPENVVGDFLERTDGRWHARAVMEGGKHFIEIRKADTGTGRATRGLHHRIEPAAGGRDPAGRSTPAGVPDPVQPADPTWLNYWKTRGRAGFRPCRHRAIPRGSLRKRSTRRRARLPHEPAERSPRGRSAGGGDVSRRRHQLRDVPWPARAHAEGDEERPGRRCAASIRRCASPASRPTVGGDLRPVPCAVGDARCRVASGEVNFADAAPGTGSTRRTSYTSSRAMRCIATAGSARPLSSARPSRGRGASRLVAPRVRRATIRIRRTRRPTRRP